MTRDASIKYEFVEFIPSEIQPGNLYISIPYATATHKCCCGCGKEVVTPFSPTDWKLIFDGQTVSLDPSIGNWSFDCKSHYLIKHNRVIWVEAWSKKRIEHGRAYDHMAKGIYFDERKIATFPDEDTSKETFQETITESGFWSRLKNLMRNSTYK